MLSETIYIAFLDCSVLFWFYQMVSFMLADHLSGVFESPLSLKFVSRSYTCPYHFLIFRPSSEVDMACEQVAPKRFSAAYTSPWLIL